GVNFYFVDYYATNIDNIGTFSLRIFKRYKISITSEEFWSYCSKSNEKRETRHLSPDVNKAFGKENRNTKDFHANSHDTVNVIVDLVYHSTIIHIANISIRDLRIDG
ncbi:Hypothetical predicted protein, partial [Mytilus galloprovincialis]